MNKLYKITRNTLLALGLLVYSQSFGQLQTAFSPRFSDAVFGDFTMIGNNMLSTTATGNYTGQDGNHNLTTVFVDIDNDNTTFNSSSANFSNPIPNINSCVTIVKAYLYWAAADFEDPGNEPNWNYNDIKVMLPGSATYTTLTADNVVFCGRCQPNHFVNDPYVCVKDITSMVQGLSSPYGKYQVANVRTKKGSLNPDHTGSNVGTSGGWQIAFVYQGVDVDGRAVLPAKYVSIFDGYANVTSSQNNYNITVSGFQTPPVGAVHPNILFGALEGDRDLTGDALQIRNVANTFVNMSTANRPTNNFFDSRITIGDNDYTDRNPASTNTLGFDAGYFALTNTSNSIIANGQTSAVLRLTSNQETYGLFMIGLSTDVWAPELEPLLQTATPSTANPGDTISYTFTVKNNGNDNAHNVVITRTLPAGVELVQPVTPLPPGVTYTYNAGTRVLSFFIQDGLVDVGDAAINISYKTVVQNECYFLETSCINGIQTQLLATYNGVQNPDQQTTLSSSALTSCGLGNGKPNVSNFTPPAVVGWGTAAGALNRTVNCSDAAALAAAEALAPVPAKCNFTLNKVTGTFVASSNSCPVTGTYTNTWTFTDKCGRTSPVYTQVITVQDTTKPSFNGQLPPNATVNCNAVPTAQTLTATDACSTATVSFNETRTNGNCTNNYTLTRTWTAKDGCNNTTVYTQTLTVQDTTKPAFNQTAPGNTTICGTPSAAPTLTASDNCGQATVSFIETIDSSQAGVKVYTRKWTATDLCGNATVATQTITANAIKSTTQNPVLCQGQSITVGAHTYSQTGIFKDTLQTSKGCDSIITTNLTVNPVLRSTQNFTLCQGGSVIVGNHSYTQTGTYFDSLQTSKGCDSIITTNLTVNPVKHTTQNPVICQGQSVTVGSHIYSQSGTFTDTLQTSKACDSIVTTNLTVNPVLRSTQSFTICQGESVSVGNHTYTQTGTYFDSLQTSKGCDSIITTNLTANPVKHTTQNPVLCQGQTITIGQHTYSQGGTFTDTLQTSKGCDSIVTTNLTVNPVLRSSQSFTRCQGESVSVGNHIYTQTGIYFDSLQTSKGCDSIVTTNLTVNPVKTTSQSFTICEGQSITVGNIVHNQSGNYSDTLQTSKACDSIVNTSLNILPRKHTQQTLTICQGESVTVGNDVHSQSGVYNDTLAAANSCDSVIVTTLIVNPVKVKTQSLTICQGQSVTIGNHIYNQNGTFVDTLSTSKGCDSIVTTNLIIIPSTTSSQTLSVCQGQQVVVGNHTYSQTGIYHDTIVNARGCDSVITTNLTVNPNKTFSQNVQLCPGEGVTVGTHTYNQPGTYTDHLQTTRGCDSTVTTVVTLNSIKHVNQTPAICQGQSITVGSHTYSQAGIFSDTLQAVNGCDSIVTTTLTVNPNKTTTQTKEICQGESLIIGNHVHTQPGNYSDTLQTSKGCDSIVNTVLIVNPNKTTSQTKIICEGESVTVGNHVHNQTGLYIDTLQTSKGCDSIVSTNLTVNPVKSSRQSLTICAGQSVTIGGHAHNQSGTYSDTLQTSLGCDSIVTTVLTVNPVIQTTQNPVLCGGETITVGNHIYSQAGTFVDTLTTSKGCDSIVTTNLTLNSIKQSTQSPVLCSGQSVTVGNHTYSQTGTFVDTLQTSKGCDSVVTTNLTVNPVKQSSQSITLCQGESVSVGNHVHNQTGIFIDTLQSSKGCDSIVTTDLTVNPVKTTSQRKIICAGESVIIGNNIHTQTGIYSDTLQTSLGCDSIITTNLTVNPVKTTSQSVALCSGQSVTVGNVVHNQTGIYVDTLQTSNGCDSIVTTDLTVKPVITKSQSLTICAGESVSVGNVVHDQTGVYVDTLQSAGGCDSIITTDLTVNPKASVRQRITICQGESVSIGNHVHNQTGIYTDTLQTSLGCDSFITTNLLVNPVAMISQTKVICTGQSVTVGNNVYTQTGMYVDTLQTSLGCDSIVTTTLTVNAVLTTSQSFALCDGESIMVGNVQHNQTGTYIDTLQTSGGCDSIVTTDLVINQKFVTQQGFTICDGESIMVGNILHNQTGNYIDTLFAFTGCDSVCYTNLIVNERKLTPQLIVLCHGQTVMVGNNVYGQTGIYVDTLQTALGCDSIITTDLTVNRIDTVPLQLFVCIDVNGQGSTVTVGGQDFNTPGQYEVKVQNAFGCDSVIELNLLGRLCDSSALLIDTLFDTIPVRTTDTVCLTFMPTPDAQVTACNGSTSGTGAHGTWEISTGTPHCLVFHADSTIGNDIICLIACDSVGLIYRCDTTIVVITVIDNPPVAIDECAETQKNTPVSISVLANDTDANHDLLYIESITQNPLYGTVVIDQRTQTVTYTPNKNFCGSDTFMYRVCDGLGGCDEGKVCVNVHCKCELPQVITPNNDGFNDVLMVPCIGSATAKILVWNRWGLLIYENDQYKNDWDGKYNGEAVPSGTYWYNIDFNDPETGEHINESNYLMIIR